MSIKLSYFDINGFAEPIRFLLHYSGNKFEDIRYDKDSWPNKEVKDSLPYGQLPFYEEGDRKLNQSIAIARYVASKSDLLPSDPWEQAVLDAAVLNIYEIPNKIRAYMSTPEESKEQGKTELFESIHFYLSRFEKELEAKNGFFGGKLSWADFVLIGFVELINLYFSQEIEKDYPNIIALTNTVRSLPGVKEYIANRKPYTM